MTVTEQKRWLRCNDKIDLFLRFVNLKDLNWSELNKRFKKYGFTPYEDPILLELLAFSIFSFFWNNFVSFQLDY